MNTDDEKQKNELVPEPTSEQPSVPVDVAVTEPSPELAPPETKASEFTLPISTSKSPSSKRKRAGIFAAIGVLVVGAGVAGWIFFGQDNDSKSTTTDTTQQERATLKAAVVLVDGTAQVSTDTVSWQDLTGEETLSEGQFVRTDASSRVVLELDDGSSVRLNGGSQLELKSLAANDIEIVNVSGEVYTRVVPSDRTFQVVAADVSYTAKGTAYKTVNTNEQKGVVVYQSTVSESEKNQEVTEGKQYYSVHPAPEKTKTISDVSVEELKADAFAKWNLELDKQNTEFKDKLGILSKIEEQSPATQTPPAPAPSASASLVLSGSVSDKGLFFTWKASGLNTSEGFKLVRSKKSQTPMYGSDSSEYIAGESTRQYLSSVNDGTTYFFRLCVYRGNSCDTYSNTVQLAAPKVAPAPVVAGPVSLSLSGDVASWTVGGTAPHGFKVLISSTSGKKYETADKSLFVASGTTNLDISTKLNSGNNYVVVCKYTNTSPACTDYSNELLVTK